MQTYEIIVTDVTCYGSLFCVAGWDRLTGRMIRPEPPSANTRDEASRFWNNVYAGPGKIFAVGNLVRFAAADPPRDFPFPHATEDRIVDLGTPVEILQSMTGAELAHAIQAGTSQSLDAAFDHQLVRPPSRKAYVPAGQIVRSLGAIELPSSSVSYFQNDYDPAKPKLRARVTVAGVVFDLSVPADAARTRWKAGGLAALREELSGSERVHVRVGLSRPMSVKPNECYAQVNGIIFL